MKPNKVFCFFEQSGTFKNQFKALGIEAEDYDILNDFGQTDHKEDLFKAIEDAYNGKPSVFDMVGGGDLIMAFFPCVRFENEILLMFRGQHKGQEKWSLERKIEYDMRLCDELNYMYQLVNKMFIYCIRTGKKLIMENPYSQEHFLRRYWCIQPSVIDTDRRERGDYFAKPTQYWFVNCEPANNIIIEDVQDNRVKHRETDSIRWISAGVMEREFGIKCSQKVARSLIHPDYANRFIREFILDKEAI